VIEVAQADTDEAASVTQTEAGTRRLHPNRTSEAEAEAVVEVAVAEAEAEEVHAAPVAAAHGEPVEFDPRGDFELRSTHAKGPLIISLLLLGACRVVFVAFQRLVPAPPASEPKADDHGHEERRHGH
jgi:hypothetical protein